MDIISKEYNEIFSIEGIIITSGLTKKEIDCPIHSYQNVEISHLCQLPEALTTISLGIPLSFAKSNGEQISPIISCQ